MPKTTVTARNIAGKNEPAYYRVCIPAPLQSEHKATRKFFKSKTEAEDFADLLNQSRQGWTAQILALPDPIQGRLLCSFSRIGGKIEDLETAVNDFLARRVAQEKPLGEVIKLALDEKAKASRSASHQKSLRLIWNAFLVNREERTANSITPDDINAFVNGRGWSNSTKRAALTKLFGLFQLSMDRGWAKSNPVESVERPDDDSERPEILTNDAVAKLFLACDQLDKPLLAYLALGAFCGVRAAEIERLTPEDIHLAEGWVVIEAAKSKTASRRVITLQPAAKAWLERSQAAAGSAWMNWKGLRGRLDRVVEAAGIRWPANCLRHSFCSNALPVFGSTDASNWAGHSEAILHRRYKAISGQDLSGKKVVLSKATALAFWDLGPEKVLAAPIPMAEAQAA